MKIGFNTVLFAGCDIETAIRYASLTGYDAVEVSAIQGMHPHLRLDHWEEDARHIRQVASDHGVALQAMEQPSRDPDQMERAFQAALVMGIGLINTGPGGKAGDASTRQQVIDELGALADRAGELGLTLCFKAHVGQYVYNTPTTLEILDALPHPSLGLDMDPSHIHRAHENPVAALSQVVRRIRHVHIRDCKGHEQGPGKPEHQANGRGDIDLLGFIRVLHEAGYQGGVDLEVIGAQDYDLPARVAIAAESRGHLQACLQACGAK